MKFFSCSLRLRLGLLQDLGDELTFRGWWCAFDDFLDFLEDEEEAAKNYEWDDEIF